MRRLPWAIWLVTVAICVATTEAGLTTGVVQFLAYAGSVLAFATVGALVASRRPGNPIGWILLSAGVAYEIGGLSVLAAEAGGHGSWDTLLAWVGAWVWMVAISPVATFGLLLFPSGRLPSARWRPVAWLAGAGLAALVCGLALAPGRFEDMAIENPLGLDGMAWLSDALAVAGAIALVAAMVGAIASLRARYASARRDERQQLKWLLYAAALVAAGVAITVALEVFAGPSWTQLSNLITTLTLSAVPVAMGIAILRHGLYDIDVVINRTLVYGALTASLGAIYLGSVLLIGLTLGTSDVAIAIASRRSRWRRCSARHARASRRWSTGASTAAATTRRRRSRRSARGCATRSTSRR